MTISIQAPAAPLAPTAPTAPAAPPAMAAPAVAAQTPAPGSITIIGSDGKAKTIIVGSDPVIAGTEVSAVPPPPSRDEFAQGMAAGVSAGSVLLLIRWLYLRFKRRGVSSPASPQISNDSTERLERLERGMESIAIEIERISEGQRFVTKLLSDSHTQAVPSSVDR